MSSNIIGLNVRGNMIMTEKSTIEQLDYFKNKLERWTENSTELFVDCDYKTFEHILNLLVTPNYIIPNKGFVLKMDPFSQKWCMENRYNIFQENR